MTETKKCEFCGKEINVASKICPFCGGEAVDPIDQDLPPMCPRCHVLLQTHTKDEEDYLICPKCAGLWVDRETFHQVTKESDVYKKEDVHKRYHRGPMTGHVEYIPCVRCGKLMNRKNFGHISGVIIDECGSHGVWLDAGELEKIRTFIVDGGLERAQDRQIEKVSAELKDLSDKVGQVAFTQRMLHFWDIKRWLFDSKP